MAFGFGELALAMGVTTLVDVPALRADVAVQRYERCDIAKRIWRIAVIYMGNGDVLFSS